MIEAVHFLAKFLTFSWELLAIPHAWWFCHRLPATWHERMCADVLTGTRGVFVTLLWTERILGVGVIGESRTATGWATFAAVTWTYIAYRNFDDDGRWKRRRQAATSKIRQAGGRLVVVSEP